MLRVLSAPKWLQFSAAVRVRFRVRFENGNAPQAKVFISNHLGRGNLLRSAVTQRSRSKRGRTQKPANERKRAHMRAEERKRANFQRIFLVSPTEKERKHVFVRAQIEYGFGCFQVRFGLVVPRGPCAASRCLAAKIASPVSRGYFCLTITLTKIVSQIASQIASQITPSQITPSQITPSQLPPHKLPPHTK